MPNLCLVVILPTFVAVQSACADMADDYSEAGSKKDGGKALQTYLQSLPSDKLLELTRDLGKRRESEAAERRKRNPAGFVDDSVQGFFYEFAAIESIRRKKAEAKMSDLTAILNGPSESNLLKRVLVEYYTSSQSPLGPCY